MRRELSDFVGGVRVTEEAGQNPPLYWLQINKQTETTHPLPHHHLVKPPDQTPESEATGSRSTRRPPVSFSMPNRRGGQRGRHTPGCAGPSPDSKRRQHTNTNWLPEMHLKRSQSQPFFPVAFFCELRIGFPARSGRMKCNPIRPNASVGMSDQ